MTKKVLWVQAERKLFFISSDGRTISLVEFVFKLTKYIADYPDCFNVPIRN